MKTNIIKNDKNKYKKFNESSEEKISINENKNVVNNEIKNKPESYNLSSYNLSYNSNKKTKINEYPKNKNTNQEILNKDDISNKSANT